MPRSQTTLRLYSILCLFLAGTDGARARETPALIRIPAGMRQVTAVEGITEYRLDNGLHVLLFPDLARQTITVNITYLVGSRNESYGETGMAHLLEHLMFKGSANHKNIPGELTAHGARPNGTTGNDRTNYFETFQSSDENLTWALDLEADRMVHSFIARKDLDSEMTVVRNEYENGENSPTNILSQRVLSTAYLWHNYGKIVIGARSDIEQVPIERLQRFWRTYYQPDNAVLVVAGKIDPSRTLALIREKFAAIPRPARTLHANYTREPTQDGERSVTLRRTGDIQALCIAYHIPAGADPDYPAVEILADILGDTPSGRLHKALVETQKASTVSAEADRLRDPGMLTLNATVRKEDSLAPARDALLQVVEGISSAPVTAEEVERARQHLLSDITLSLGDSDRIGLQLSEWEAMGDWRLLFLHRDQLKAVRVEDVQRAATRYLKTSNRTLGLFIPTDKPDRSEIPAAPDLASLLKDYKGGEAAAAGEAFDTSPANLARRTQQVFLKRDPGGLKLALLPRKTRGALVEAVLTLHYGDANSLFDRSFAATLASGMLLRGTTQHTRRQIQDELDRLKAHVHMTFTVPIALIPGPVEETGVTIETIRENLPAVLKLVAEILRHPSFPLAEFEQLKQEQAANYAGQKTDPSWLATVAMCRHMLGYPRGDVRYQPTMEESVAAINALTLEQVKGFYTDFYGASNADLAVVGDFDAPEVTRLAADLFGDWKSPHPYKHVERPYRNIPAARESIETPDKAGAYYYAILPVQLKDDDPDYPAMDLGNYMLGGGFIHSRLATRLRQKEGLSYSVSSALNVYSLDRAGFLFIYAIYNPRNVGKVETAVKEELQRAVKDGFTPEELIAAKSGYLQSRQVARGQDSGLASTLSYYLSMNRTFAYDGDLERKINTLTPDQVNSALRKYIHPDQITVITAGDFAKSASQPAPK